MDLIYYYHMKRDELQISYSASTGHYPFPDLCQELDKAIVQGGSRID